MMLRIFSCACWPLHSWLCEDGSWVKEPRWLRQQVIKSSYLFSKRKREAFIPKTLWSQRGGALPLPNLICCPGSPSPIFPPLASNSQHTQASASSSLQTKSLTGFARNRPGWIPHRDTGHKPQLHRLDGVGPQDRVGGNTRGRTATRRRGHPGGCKGCGWHFRRTGHDTAGHCKDPMGPNRGGPEPHHPEPYILSHKTYRVPGQFSTGMLTQDFSFSPLGRQWGKGGQWKSPSCPLGNLNSSRVAVSLKQHQCLPRAAHTPDTVPQQENCHWDGPCRVWASFCVTPSPNLKLMGPFQRPAPRERQGVQCFLEHGWPQRMHQEHQASFHSRLPMFTLLYSRNYIIKQSQSNKKMTGEK